MGLFWTEIVNFGWCQLSICGAMTRNHGDEDMHDTWLSSFDMERKIDEAAPIRTACSINRSEQSQDGCFDQRFTCLIFITSSQQEMIKSLGRVEVGCKKQRRCRGRAFQKVNQETTEADFWALPG